MSLGRRRLWLSGCVCICLCGFVVVEEREGGGRRRLVMDDLQIRQQRRWADLAVGIGVTACDVAERHAQATNTETHRKRNHPPEPLATEDSNNTYDTHRCKPHTRANSHDPHLDGIRGIPPRRSWRRAMDCCLMMMMMWWWLR